MIRFRHVLISAAMLLAAGCQPDGPAAPSGAALPGASVGQAAVSCDRTCNTEYDTCTQRFAGVGATGAIGQRSDDPASNLGPNDVCPDQLKSCLRRCGS